MAGELIEDAVPKLGNVMEENSMMRRAKRRGGDPREEYPAGSAFMRLPDAYIGAGASKAEIDKGTVGSGENLRRRGT